MPTTGVFNGTSLVLKVATTSGGTYNVVGKCQSSSLSVSMDLPEATSKDSAGYVEHIAGSRSASLSFSGLVAYDDTVDVDFFLDYMIGSSNGRSKLYASWSTNVTGDKIYTAAVYVSSIEYTSDAEAPVTFSGELVVTGAITTADVS